MNIAPFTAIEGGQPAASRLAKTYRRAMAFQPERTAALLLTPEAVQRAAADEAAGGRVTVDAHGLTPGLRQHVLRPAREMLSEWRGVRRDFEAALEPKRADIDATEHLDAGINSLRMSARDELAKVVETWRLIERNKVIEQDWKDARNVYGACGERNGGRVANRLAHLPIYWAGLLLVAMLAWRVNHGAFLALVGQPEAAAGAALVVAALLAIAAHCHGALIKQWAIRFSRDRPKALRRDSLRLATVGTLAAVASLAAAATAAGCAGGGVAAASVMGACPWWGEAGLSLLANAALLALGAWLAHVCHDRDPHFMAATRIYRRARRRYDRARRAMTGQMKRLEAHYARRIMAMQIETLSRVALVTREKGQLAHVKAREAAIIGALLDVVRTNTDRYRQALAQHVVRRQYEDRSLGRQSRTGLFADAPGRCDEMSAYDWLSMMPRIDASLLIRPAPDDVPAPGGGVG